MIQRVLREVIAKSLPALIQESVRQAMPSLLIGNVRQEIGTPSTILSQALFSPHCTVPSSQSFERLPLLCPPTDPLIPPPSPTEPLIPTQSVTHDAGDRTEDDDEDSDDHYTSLPMASMDSLPPPPGPVPQSSLPPSSAPSTEPPIEALTERIFRSRATRAQPSAVPAPALLKRAASPESMGTSKRPRHLSPAPSPPRKPRAGRNHPTLPMGRILVPNSEPTSSASHVPHRNPIPLLPHAIPSQPSARGTPNADIRKPPPEPLAPWPVTYLPDAIDEHEEDWAEHVHHCLIALRNLGHDGPKSRSQLLAMILVLHRMHNFIFILPTGFGKSLLYLFIATLAPNLHISDRFVGGNTIVICPYRALLMDQFDKSTALKLRVFNWQDRMLFAEVPTDTRILFIQPESFNSQSFQE